MTMRSLMGIRDTASTQLNPIVEVKLIYAAILVIVFFNWFGWPSIKQYFDGKGRFHKKNEKNKGIFH